MIKCTKHALDIVTAYFVEQRINELVLDINERNKILAPAKEMTIDEIEKKNLVIKLKSLTRRMMMSNDILECEVEGRGVNMTVVEFAENFLGLKLLHYQKLLLEKMSDLPKDSKIVYGRLGKVYLIKGNKNE